MSVKLKNDVSYTRREKQKENEKDCQKKNFSKVEALYLALMCFATHCLSCITLEAGNRSPHSHPMTKSAAFNALFRRTYNLKIIILVTNIITGLITTLMTTFADKYDIPYLYLPWLINTMKGMALYEGPRLLSLANVLLPDVTLPTATFMLTTLFLYVEEICIWSNIFIKFQHCWKNYHNEKHTTAEKAKEKLFAKRNKKLLYQDNIEAELSLGVSKLKPEQKPNEFCNNINNRFCNDVNNRFSNDTRLRSIKSTIGDNGNFLQTQLPDITG